MSDVDWFNEDRTPQALIEARAAEWLIARLHDNGWNDEKQAKLEAWFCESIAHEVAYLRLEAGWNGADRLSILRTQAQLPSFRPSNFSGTNRLHIAAVLVLCAAVGVGAYLTMQPTREQVFATPVGGRESITLADGSQIDLNTNTELRLPKDSRQATLVRGEAYFQIKHDVSHPFTLLVADHRIVDLGTKFSVRQKADALEVRLVEGSARIERVSNVGQPQSAVLKPGDVATASVGHLTVTRKSQDILADTLSWRSGFVVFHHTSLRQAANEFNRYSVRQIVISDDAAAGRVFAGKFRTTDSERFANVAAAALGLHVDMRGSEIVISEK